MERARPEDGTGRTELLAVTAHSLTIDDLDTFPDDGWRSEIVDGTLVVLPPPVIRHSVVVNELSHLLHAAAPPEFMVLATGAGVQMRTDRMLIPDLVVVCREAAA